MDFDDILDPKVVVAVAVTAAVTSKPVRKAFRKGAVYGLAGLLVAKDRLSTVASSFADSAQQAAAAAKKAAEDVPEGSAQTAE
ncbi:MAG: hypothetical protein EA424_15260 [Planctomycetaceae bacterium]|nr:MAG: hypothetical protein EA424_15260 [Planctomycetaceae bacterium]